MWCKREIAPWWTRLTWKSSSNSRDCASEPDRRGEGGFVSAGRFFTDWLRLMLATSLRDKATTWEVPPPL
ncbi:MAG: hypothetical protein QOF93_1560 [Verrucomicrobiota bacterium]